MLSPKFARVVFLISLSTVVIAQNTSRSEGVLDASCEVVEQANRDALQQHARVLMASESGHRMECPKFIDERRNADFERQHQADRDVHTTRVLDGDGHTAAISTGTGFFITSDGYMVTNHHVISGKTHYAIRDSKGDFYRADLVARDHNRDLALLKVRGTFPALRIADSDMVTKGQRVLTVGYPQVAIQGNESKVTDGIISSFSGLKNDDQWFQISVPIQAGNSGGPLVTEAGYVVGVVVATVNAERFYSLGGTLPQNVNYAIKSKVLWHFLKEQGIVNAPSAKGKTAIDAADRATVLVIAKGGPLEVNFAVSSEQKAQEESERARLATEAAKRRKAAEDAENARVREEQRAADRRRRDVGLIEMRDRDITKAFPDWKEIQGSVLFNAWLRSQPPEVSEAMASSKSERVIPVLKRYRAQRVEFREKHLDQKGAWIVDANGCRFLDLFPGRDWNIGWSGKCDQGRGSGNGRLTWLKAGEAQVEATGFFEDGMLQGHGRIESDNGRVLEGEFREGELRGVGRIVYKDGGSYEGFFKNGQFHGQGKQVLKDGSVFEGEFREGKLEGLGIAVYRDESSCVGEFREGKLEGRGRCDYKDGSIYEGSVQDGKFHGYGKLVLKNGKVFEGVFYQGNFRGSSIVSSDR